MLLVKTDVYVLLYDVNIFAGRVKNENENNSKR